MAVLPFAWESLNVYNSTFNCYIFKFACKKTQTNKQTNKQIPAAIKLQQTAANSRKRKGSLQGNTYVCTFNNRFFNKV